MSGHSKWSNIHRKKEANDKVRSGIFTKLSSGIMMAVKKGGGITDPDQNYSLRLAIEKARSANMPKDNIDRAIAKASGRGSEAGLAELLIEGFAPGGVVLMVLAVTDNRNRTIAEIRTILEKNGGRMGETGSVGYLFDHKEGEYVAKYPVTLKEEQREKVDALLQLISEQSDTLEVYANLV